MTSPLITVDRLQAMLQDPALCLFDCRFELLDPAAGQVAYAKAHVPGAVFVDINRELSTPHLPGRTGRHPLPTREAWSSTAARLGLGPQSKVVIYDDRTGASAARLWWMLLWIGHDNVAVLDGGWQAWLAAGLPVTTEASPARAAASAYPVRASLVSLLNAAEVDGQRQLLLDARDLPRYRGDVEPIDPVAGHIPGAQCSPFSANVQADGRFKPVAELQEKFAVAKDAGKPVVCYCGSGITACHNILAMVAAGLPLPALYAGSWSEWITAPERPVARGDNN